jgi:hypothetical protein
MRYPEEVYRPGGKGGEAPAAEAELSREERRARRGAKKRSAKKHRAQKVRENPRDTSTRGPDGHYCVSCVTY